ncbi:MAG: creatininase family protein [Halorhabdus sp.]
MYLADEAWPDLETYFEDESIALMPLGSTEQHGPHLPEGTDHLIAQAFAREVADRTGYLATPTVTVGVSGHHQQFPGTMSADPRAFRDYVESVTRSLTTHGIDRVIYVNAHGGNVEHLREIGRRLRETEAAYAIEWMWDESISEAVDDAFEHNGPHGGPKETALIQHLHPDLVHADRLDDAREGGLVEVEETIGRVHGSRTFYDSIDNSDNGVFGDQTEASAEIGAELFAAAADELQALAVWLADQAFEDLMPKDHV